jgi:hypothetical protein
MQVKVKKEVLFNLLKKALNENRTFNNPSGNFIHDLDRNETPILPSPHMSMQVSIEEPPVGDENYIPASISELRAAAARIAEEVPPDQVENYYRALHRLLDSAIDRSNTISEARAYWQEDEINPSTSDDYMGSDSSSVDEGNLEDVKNDPLLSKILKKLEKDPYFDVTKQIQKLSDLHGVPFSDIEDLIYNKKSDEEEEEPIETKPVATTPSAAFKTSSMKEPKFVDTDESDLPELSPEDEARLRGSVSLGDNDIDRDAEIENKPHKALTSAYWVNALNSVKKGKTYPLQTVAQVVMDSMDAVSRVIATQTSVNFGFGGGTPSGTVSPSLEAKSWKGILSNDVNTNPEVVYKLPEKQKTKDFWKKRVFSFIDKLQKGDAGSLSPFTDKFVEIASYSYDVYEKETGFDIIKFMTQVTNRVVESILEDPNYGATTRNVASTVSNQFTKMIDTGFIVQLKKYPFEIPTRTAIDAQIKNKKLNPDRVINFQGEKKSVKETIIDVVVAYIITKSEEFKILKKDIDPELKDFFRLKEISRMIDTLSNSKTFTFSVGTGENRESFVLSKSDVVQEVSLYVDKKFEPFYMEEEILDDTYISDSDTEAMLENPDIPTKEKEERFKEEIASKIMKNTGSVATLRDYMYRVLDLKWKTAFKDLEGVDDPDKMDDANYITIFNDTLAEIIPSVEQAIISLARQGKSEGLEKEDLEVFIESLVQIRAIKEFVYSKKTRGGESTIQNMKGNNIIIDDESYDMLDFFSDSRNVGSSILRAIVSSLIGSSLKGTGMQSIETINFAFEEKVRRQAENVEDAIKKAMLSLYSGISLVDAQNTSIAVGIELGLPETKSIFLEKNMKELQDKTVYPFVGRVKKMPDFKNLNPPAKNFICWFSAIADKRYRGAATLEERTRVAEELFNKLLRTGDSKVQTAADNVNKVIEKTQNVVNKILIDVEALEDFTQKEVKRIIKNPDLMKQIIKQALRMHFEDLEMMDNKE